MHQPFEYQFEWDPIKARLNYRKHGISFERAVSVFNDLKALSIFDEDHSHWEERWTTLGLDQTGILIVVCHTFQYGQNRALIRIFSARKATRKENHQY